MPQTASKSKMCHGLGFMTRAENRLTFSGSAPQLSEPDYGQSSASSARPIQFSNSRLKIVRAQKQKTYLLLTLHHSQNPAKFNK
jgi:hypothetical protein